MKKLSRSVPFLTASAALLVPLLVAAQTPNINAIKPYSDAIINLINNILVPVLMAIAFIVFLYGVYRYFILGADNETERTTGKEFVLWGLIGFVIILSIWGLVNIVSSTLGLDPGGSAPPTPKF